MARYKLFAKRILAMGLSMVLLLSAFGCSSEKNSASGSSPAKGRYVETALSLPGDQYTKAPIALSEENGKLKLLSESGLFVSGDHGASWQEETVSSPTLQKHFSTDYTQRLSRLSSAAWAPNGDLLFSYAETNVNTNEQETHYILADQNGTEREIKFSLPEVDWGQNEEGSAADVSDPTETGDTSSLPAAEGEETGADVTSSSEFIYDPENFTLENTLSNFHFLPDGSLLGLDFIGRLLHLDLQTGKVLHTLKNGSSGSYTSFAVVKELLYAMAYDRIELYSTADWSLQKADATLSSFLGGEESDGTEAALGISFTVGSSGGILSGSGDVLLFSDPQEEALYLCTNSGVFRHVPGGSAVEQVINGALNSLSDPAYQPQKVFLTSSDSFYNVCYQNESNDSILLRYDYDPDLDSTPETELKVFAFRESNDLRRSIAAYQKAHPDVYVNLELANTEISDSTSKSDLLRTLNASIMAGKGPDVLFLDDMPVSNYLEKGLLLDLRELTEGEALFENIISAYRGEDGSLCAIPTRFSLPLMVASDSLLSSASDLSTLADTVEKLREENPKQTSITGLNRPYSLLEALYPVCAPTWSKDDGSLSEEKLLQFLKEGKRLYTAERKGFEKDDSLYFSGADLGGLFGVGLLQETELITLGTLLGYSDLSCLSTVTKKLSGHFYKPLPGQAENVFLPQNTVGISAKSTQQEAAKDFVKFLLSRETQEKALGSYFPVHSEALKTILEEEKSTLEKAETSIISVYSEVGGSYNLDLELLPLTDEDISGFFALAESLTTPFLEDPILKEAVLEEAAACLAGEKSEAEACEAILRKVDLHLSES